MTRHVANSYNCRVVSSEGLYKEIHYRGVDPVKHCYQSLLDISNELYDTLQNFRAPLLSLEETIKFDSSNTCHICKKDFDKNADNDAKNYKVRDHCHVTGKFRGAAHNNCNLACRTCKKFPVFIHNLKGYDSHLLFQDIESFVTDVQKLNVIASNTEKYISFSLDKLVFKDSYQFLASSLRKLASNLTINELVHTSKLADELNLDIKLLTRKGVYPYQWFDNTTKFDETKLPPIECFRSDLNDEDCDPEDYKHAHNVWNAMGCKTFGDYHDMYLKLDVALLADVFETFRYKSLEIYVLDPAHYFTLPGFSWDALFKMTEVKLE
jgi:hypothetical protein